MNPTGEKPSEKPPEPSSFEAAARIAPPSIAAEFITFLKEEKKWWLGPIVLVLLLVGLLIVLGGTGAAPFIYTLF